MEASAADILALNFAPPVDLLLRYLTTFDRSIARTLDELERLQRARKGQPVPPRIELELKG